MMPQSIVSSLAPLRSLVISVVCCVVLRLLCLLCHAAYHQLCAAACNPLCGAVLLSNLPVVCRYIDFEIALSEHNNARSLFERLLDRTKHVKVCVCLGPTGV